MSEKSAIEQIQKAIDDFSLSDWIKLQSLILKLHAASANGVAVKLDVAECAIANVCAAHFNLHWTIAQKEKP